jgi:hypothetical protein
MLSPSMKGDVLPLERTAAAVIAAHASALDEARKSRRRIAWVCATILVVLVALEFLVYPRTQPVHVTRKRVVDVFRVTRNAGLQRAFARYRAGLGTALVVQYFSDAQGSQAQGLERLDVFEWARPQAEREGIRFIVLSRMEPVLARWVPVQRNDFYPFRLKEDGTWGGL